MLKLRDYQFADDHLRYRPQQSRLAKFLLEALRFQRWYLWRHASDFKSMMIMVAHFGLTFWQTEEDWSLQWIGCISPICHSAKDISMKLREVSQIRVGADPDTITSAPFRSSIHVSHFMLVRGPLKGIIIQEPSTSQKLATLNIPDGKGKAPMVDIKNYSPSSSSDQTSNKADNGADTSVPNESEKEISQLIAGLSIPVPQPKPHQTQMSTTGSIVHEDTQFLDGHVSKIEVAQSA